MPQPDQQLAVLSRRVDELFSAAGKSRRFGEMDLRGHHLGGLSYSRDDQSACPRREILAMIAAGGLPGGGVTVTGGTGGVLKFDDLTPLLTETGTTWNLAANPSKAADLSVFLDGTLIRQVTSGPGQLQYTYAAGVVTTGHTLIAGQVLEAIYRISTDVLTFDDLTPLLTETGTSWNLSKTPAAVSELAVFLNGLKLRKVAATPNENQFTLSAATITTGRALIAGESLEAMYNA